MNRVTYLIQSMSRIYPSCNMGFMQSRSVHLTKVQCLYAQAAIGIDGYLHTRRKIKDQFTNFSDKFRTKMQDFIQDPKQMIFTEDLKNMVHMAEPTDLQLVLDMVKKFNTQKTEFRFGSFVFGPVVMRMFYFLDAPNEALKCFNDPDNNGFFDQLVSYQVLLDLLYNNERYDDMYDTFDKVKERQINMTKYPKYPVVLILAACYKQNTEKSYLYAKNLWSEMASVGTVPLRRACAFTAALALKRGEPSVALEIISLQSPYYVTMRNIKAVALAQIGRVEDSLPILKAVLEIDVPKVSDKHTFFSETIERIREEVDKANNNDLKKEFENIENALKDRNLIDNQTLDKLVTSEITINLNKTQQRNIPRMPFKQRPFVNKTIG